MNTKPLTFNQVIHSFVCNNTFWTVVPLKEKIRLYEWAQWPVKVSFFSSTHISLFSVLLKLSPGLMHWEQINYHHLRFAVMRSNYLIKIEFLMEPPQGSWIKIKMGGFPVLFPQFNKVVHKYLQVLPQFSKPWIDCHSCLCAAGAVFGCVDKET